MKKPNCHCAAYSFPHRVGGGKCQANCTQVPDTNRTDFRLTWKCQDLCLGCGLPTKEVRSTWDDQVVYASDCCDSNVVENKEGWDK